MIPGLDSSYAHPTRDQLRAAKAAGIGIWAGYLVSASDEQVLAARARGQGMYGLLAPWTRAEFAVVQEEGLATIGFCSGRDDPAALRVKGEAWGALPCVDAEPGIRADGEGGNWIPGFLAALQGGLYGLASVHYHTGEPLGRGARFNIVARYPTAGCGTATWDPAAGPRPPAPCGWQCQGTHTEVGIPVDRGNYDDWFVTGIIAVPRTGGIGMGGTVGGFYDDEFHLDHTFELSADGHLLWARTVGGGGGQLHIPGWWDLGAPPDAKGGVAEFAVWPTSGGGAIVRAKTADGMAWELPVSHRGAATLDEAMAGFGGDGR